MSGERITELLREMPPVDVDHDFRAPLYGDASLDEVVGDAVLEVCTAVPSSCASGRHVADLCGPRPAVSKAQEGFLVRSAGFKKSFRRFTTCKAETQVLHQPSRRSTRSAHKGVQWSAAGSFR